VAGRQAAKKPGAEVNITAKVLRFRVSFRIFRRWFSRAASAIHAPVIAWRHILTHRMLLTPREMAERLNCSTRKLERDRLTGAGPPYVKLGALIRYPEDELDAWLKSRIRRSTSEVAA
jgi:excisionase family DNA binding protein